MGVLVLAVLRATCDMCHMWGGMYHVDVGLWDVGTWDVARMRHI